MNIITVAAAASGGSLADFIMGVPAWNAVGSIVGILVVLVGTLLLIVRRSDLRSIDNATAALKELVNVVGQFREDLAGIREWIAREYATKSDLRDLRAETKELDRKIERVREHATERRVVRESEGT